MLRKEILVDPVAVVNGVTLEWLATDCSGAPATLGVEINGIPFFNEVSDPFMTCSCGPTTVFSAFNNNPANLSQIIGGINNVRLFLNPQGISSVLAWAPDVVISLP